MKKILIILCCIVFLTGCSNNSDKTNKEKLNSEIDFIGSQIAELFHNLNNITLENYELISEIISISENSGAEGESSSQGGSSQASSGGTQSQSGGSSQGGSQGGEQSSQSGGGEQDISVTEMQNNSILNIDTENVDWNLIKEQAETINTSWTVVMLDLYENKVSNEDIMAFSNLLDATIIAIKNEDKETTLTNLTNLYSYIPKFLTAISADKNTQNIELTKYYVFTAYAAASQDDWNAVTTNMSNAENNFLSIVNDKEYTKNKEYKIHKTYLLIKDLQNSIVNQDKQLFFLKYKNLIESLNTL